MCYRQQTKAHRELLLVVRGVHEKESAGQPPGLLFAPRGQSGFVTSRGGRAGDHQEEGGDGRDSRVVTSASEGAQVQRTGGHAALR